MPDAHTQQDALGLYYTAPEGASTPYGQQESLGGLRRAPIPRRGWRVDVGQQFGGLLIEQVSGACGEGAHSVRLDEAADQAFFSPANADEGAGVAIAEGDSKVVVSDDAAQWVRVRRFGADEYGETLFAGLHLDLGVLPDTLTGQDATVHFGWMLHNASAQDLSAIKVWFDDLGTAQTSDSAQLSASGSGTIETTGSFADWPLSGWARIEESDGTLREYVYYSERTESVLTVPSAGRGRLGTSAGAGASDDSVRAAPGMALALETPNADGSIQTIGNAIAAPTGVTFSAPMDEADAVSVSDLGVQQNYGLWLAVDVVSGMTGRYGQEGRLRLSHDYAGATYTDDITLVYHVAQSADAVYRLWVDDSGGRPEPGNAADAEGGLPISASVSSPGSGTKVVRALLREVNAYNLESLNRWHDGGTGASRLFVIDANGDEVTVDVSAPAGLALTDYVGGYVRIAARYAPSQDAQPADQWAMYLTSDGSDPDPATDTPTLVTMEAGLVGDETVLRRFEGPFEWQQDVRVIVRARRSSDGAESTNSTVLQLDVGTTDPQPIAHVAVVRPGFSSRDQVGFLDEQVTLGASGAVYWRRLAGETQFWMDGVLVLRALAHGAGTEALWMPRTWSIRTGQALGAGTNEQVEVVSATEVYLNVGGSRQVLLDKTNQRIDVGYLATGQDGNLPEAPVAAAAQVVTDALALVVWDRGAAQYRPWAQVTNTGGLELRGALVKRVT